MQQHWVGSTDTNFMLTQIGGWAVGCYNDREARAAVVYAIERGWVGERVHYTPSGETWHAYELTDAGIAEVGRLYGDATREDQIKRRQWYRDRVPITA